MEKSGLKNVKLADIRPYANSEDCMLRLLELFSGIGGETRKERKEMDSKIDEEAKAE